MRSSEHRGRARPTESNQHAQHNAQTVSAASRADIVGRDRQRRCATHKIVNFDAMGQEASRATDIVLDVTKKDGIVKRTRVRCDATQLNVRFFCFVLFFARSSRCLTSRVPRVATALRSATHRRVQRHRAADTRVVAERLPFVVFVSFA